LIPTRNILIYVWLGRHFPSWMKDSLAISGRNSKISTVLLSNSSAGNFPDVDHQIFIEDFYIHEPSVMPIKTRTKAHNFRDGFWIKTSERFLVLASFVKKYKIESFFHAELDVAVFGLNGLGERLDTYASGFFCPRDSVDRGIASLIYCNNVDTLKSLVAKMSCLDGESVNDMSILGELLKSEQNFYSLPTERELNLGSTNSQWRTVPLHVSGGIFDAAAIGQYLFGIDSRNTSNLLLKNGFKNENCGIN